jgi:hypothetical protein
VILSEVTRLFLVETRETEEVEEEVGEERGPARLEKGQLDFWTY